MQARARAPAPTGPLRARAGPRARAPAQVRVSSQNLLVERPLGTRVAFGGEVLEAQLSRKMVDAAMHMLGPGESATLHDGACRWTVTRAALANEVAVRCTRAAGRAGSREGPAGPAGVAGVAGAALLGLSATLTGSEMTVRCAELEPGTRRALAYMNDQLLPRREGCAEALAALRAGVAAGASGAAARSARAGWHVEARTGIPSLFRENNRGVVSWMAEGLGAPRRCRAEDVGREVYLAGLMSAAAPKTDSATLVVGSAGRALPLDAALAQDLYREPPSKLHVSVVMGGETGPERVNCNVRAVRAESALARRLGDALAPLGLAARGDCFVLSGPMAGNFALVFREEEGGAGDGRRPGSARRAARAAAVGRALALAHA